jgi:hypothetical protein
MSLPLSLHPRANKLGSVSWRPWSFHWSISNCTCGVCCGLCIARAPLSFIAASLLTRED